MLHNILNHPDCQIAINCSGGKDSQAMLVYLNRLFPSVEKFAIHANLGEMEWPQTLPFIEKLCQKERVKLVTIKHQLSLLAIIRERYRKIQAKGETKPFWPSANARYCTSTAKVLPINKYLRKLDTNLIVNTIGIRAEESTNRRRKTPLKIRKDISSVLYQDCTIEQAFKLYQSNKNKRLVVDWYPIYRWNLDRVWTECGTSTQEWEARRKLPDDLATQDWPAHPVYVLGHGNTRLSCAFCVLGNINDLTNAVKLYPTMYRTLVEMEESTGYTFQNKRSLKSLAERPRQLELF